MTIQAHADAILALLRAAVTNVYPTETGTPGSDEQVPATAVPPYVSVHFHREFAEPQSMDGLTTRVVMRVACHCVGADEVGARAVSQKVADALLDVTPVVAGRTCFPIRHEQSVPPRIDETAGLVVDLTEWYRLETD